MIKFLFDNCKDFPVIGGPIKAAYIGVLVKNVVKEGKRGKSAKELSNLTGEELEGAINEEANSIFDENITPEIKQYMIPDALIAPIKEKAIKEITAKLREKAQEKVEKKTGISSDKK